MAAQAQKDVNFDNTDANPDLDLGQQDGGQQIAHEVRDSSTQFESNDPTVPSSSNQTLQTRSRSPESDEFLQSFSSTLVILSRQIQVAHILLNDSDTIPEEFRDCRSDLRNSRLKVQDAETLCRNNQAVHSEANTSCMLAVSLESKLARRSGALKQRLTADQAANRVKLEAVKTPRFDGDVTEYMRFKAQFRELVQENCSPAIALLKLRDEALIRGSSEHMLVSGAKSVDEAFKELDDSFLNSEIIQSALISKIRTLKPAQNYYDLMPLKMMVSTITSVIKDLDTLSSLSALDMAVFSTLMVKLPSRLRDDIDKQIAISGVKKKVSTLEKIQCVVSELKFRCRLVETHAQRTKAYAPNVNVPLPKKPNDHTSNPYRDRRRDGIGDSMLQGQDPAGTCLFHPDAKRHFTHRCNKLRNLSAQEIRVTLESNRYCLCCFQPLGPSHQCNVVCPELNCPKPRSHSKLVHSACVSADSPIQPRVAALDASAAGAPLLEDGRDDSEDVLSDAESTDSNTTCLVASKAVVESSASTSVVTVGDYVGRNTLRPSHIAYVRTTAGPLLPVNVMYDGGSDLSEVMSSVVQQMDLQPVGVISDFRVNVAASTVPTEIGRCELHNLPLLDISGREIALAQVVSVPWIGKLREVKTHDALREIHSHGDGSVNILPSASGPIHVLLGSNCPQLFPSRLHSFRSLEIGLTRFGPILYGSHPSFCCDGARDEIIHSHLISSPLPDMPDCLLSIQCPAVATKAEGDFLDPFTGQDTDHLPCAKCGHSLVSPDTDSQRRLQIYQDCIRFALEERKVYTTFPWRSDLSAIPDNRTSALQRLNRLTSAAVRDPELTSAYVAEMDRMVESGVLVEVTESEDAAWKARGGRVWYVGHFPVKNPLSKSTPVRPVFDPSVPFKGITLSKLWEQPPNLIPQIVDMYVGFRDMPIAVCLDFKKAYWTLWLGDVESHMHRIVYNRLDPRTHPKTYRITRNSWGMVPAGALCSLAMITVSEHFRDRFPKVHEFIRTQLYVDDGATSCETIEEALQLARDTHWVMSQGGFVLKHFIIGGKPVDCSAESLPGDVPDVVRLGKAQERVLGAIWEPLEDVLSFACKVNFSKKRNGAFVDADITLSEFDDRFPKQLTLRMYLSVISTLFDPLGLVCPITISLKHEFGRLLNLGLSWADDIPRGSSEGPSYERCRELIRCLFDVTRLSFPRCARPLGLSLVGNPVLVGFCDASELAFAACVFYCFRTSDGDMRSRLVIAKAKPLPKRAPLLTIPRAELEACTALSKLVARVLTSSRYVFERTILLSDSTICLGQILASPYRLKQWPATRVQAILDRTDQSSWFHVRSQNNVADIATRGVSVEHLGQDSVWQIGASFMRLPLNEWPIVPAAECSVRLGHSKLSDEQLEARVRDPRMLISREPTIYIQNPDQTNPIRDDMTSQNVRSVSDLSPQSRLGLVQFLSALQFTPPHVGTSWTRLRRRVARATYFILNISRWLQQRKATGQRFSIEGFSDMNRKNQRVWIEENDSYSPSPELMAVAEVVWSRKAQEAWSPKDFQDMAKLNPQRDQFGVWKALGRIHTIQKAPVLLPGDQTLSEVILLYFHRLHHSSADSSLALARERFWIRRGQVLANRVVSSCVTCRRLRKRPPVLELGPLPDFRRQRYPVFSAIFIDICGPFFCTADRRNTRGNPAVSAQVWVLVLICAVSHAVHIELLESYSTENFLSALDTFISIRGTPHKIIADQGSQLTAGGEVTTALRNHLCESTEWHFVPSGAHQFVGMAEALVKAVKSSLDVLYIPKYTNLTKLQFARILYGVANLVNDRPLAVGRTRVSKLDDMRLIRPNDLLLGRTTPDSLPPMDMEALVKLSANQQRFVELLRIRDACMNQFWVHFHSVVFQTLLPRPTNFKTGRQFCVGDVVLIKDTNPIRGVWSWGQIESILPSLDGKVREVTVRYKADLISRNKKARLEGVKSKYVRKSVRDLALLLESEI